MNAETKPTSLLRDEVKTFRLCSTGRIVDRAVEMKILSFGMPGHPTGSVLVRFFYSGRKKYARRDSWIQLDHLRKWCDNEAAALEYAREKARALGWSNPQPSEK